MLDLNDAFDPSATDPSTDTSHGEARSLLLGLPQKDLDAVRAACGEGEIVAHHRVRIQARQLLKALDKSDCHVTRLRQGELLAQADPRSTAASQTWSAEAPPRGVLISTTAR